MLLFVSTKGERLANWTTVVSKVFLPAPLSFPPILSAQSWGLQCPQMEGEGRRLTGVVRDVRGGLDWHSWERGA